jgi:hypothetical protein
MNGKQHIVGYYSPSVKKDIEKTLKQFDLHREFEFAVKNLKINPYIGDKISEEHWPVKYRNLGIKNLHRYVLSNKHPGWRLIYTITADGNIKILIALVDVLNHHRYDRLFGYG